MKIYVFPGQGAQFEGMGKELVNVNPKAKNLFDKADEVLGFKLSEIMFEGSAEDLRQTKVTQPAVFLYSFAKFLELDPTDVDAVAGHSLGELTALVAAQCISFEDGLNLVYKRALAMQEACEASEGTMAAILGLDDKIVEDICASIEEIVVPANYNCPGQLVISGSVAGINKAVAKCQEAGARRAIVLTVGGAFHSPFMVPAEEKLRKAIESTEFITPKYPIYQNVSGAKETDPESIKQNLIAQLTSPVKWTATMNNFIDDGVNIQSEMGAKVLTGFIKKVDRKFETEVHN